MTLALRRSGLAAAFLMLMNQPAQAENTFSLGVEGFRDVYKEYALDAFTGKPISVDTHTDYGSITGSYTHYSGGFFSGIDGRYSQGTSDYKSISGTAGNIPDKEGEVRVRTGVTYKTWHGVLMPYIGAGLRMYYDKFKDAGPGGYDRHITQFYLPVGMSYRYVTPSRWTFTPSVEVDPILWGEVDSHLGSVGAPYTNITNTQHSGVGLRGDFMAGQEYTLFSWEAGPFFRYWNVPDSDVALSPAGGFIEPKNTRLQYGLALRVNY